MRRTPTNCQGSALPRVALVFALAPRVMALSLALGPLGLTFSRSAAAQQADSKALARQHFQRGVELANESAYGESLLEFSRAYQLSPHYSVLYNIAQAHVALGHAAQAVDAFKRYLSEGGAHLALDRRQEVEAEIIRQFARTATLEVRVDTERASVTIDGEPRGLSPLAGPVRVDVGAHRVSVALESGELRSQTVSVLAGKNQLVEFQLRPSSPPPESPPLPPPPRESRAVPAPPAGGPASDRTRSTLGLAIGAVGVGLGGAALAHFLWNRSRHRDWQAKYDHYFAQPTPENREEANQLAESIPRANVVTLSLTIGAGIALGSGTFLLVTDGGSGKALGSVVGWRGVW